MPSRQPLRLKQAEVAQPFRHYDCSFYHHCLKLACVGRWESWSCTGCRAFEPAVREAVSHNRGQDW